MNSVPVPATPAAALSWPAILRPLLAGDDLSSDAAAWAMGQVIGGDASPAQLAAFVVALRAKGETAAEIDGFVSALLRAAPPVPIPGPIVDIVGTGGDGTNAVNISTMAAIVVAATGATVVKHGGRAASATSAGSADLVERLGVPLDLSVADLVAVAAEAGITFLFAPQVHPGMRHAGPVRRELGVPTVFNVLGPLINPANPTHRLIGVADPRLLPVIAEVLRRRGANALVVRGDDGLDKLSTAATSQVWRVRGHRATREVFDPRAVGIRRCAEGALRGGDADINARVAHELLAGKPGAVRDAVLLNAAGALVAAAPADDPLADLLPPAMDRCAAAIDSGAAADLLARWVDVARVRRRGSPQSPGAS
ncbi:anthranilate phosphoribosyltransferase [Rugosimonospora africana]|uniref:Anthranilate phosphoribosyltransferase n=1 Tax=Rugosimonospora africana TaxID=556532 RepID=A0A8J3QY12_9ACTN|nr:anthranilate phosphoribosyltransferase [Rugosimonospora africana]GIH18217.1 anthranilate phosphoribosyltransferase [Rugosimonospora africana]